MIHFSFLVRVIFERNLWLNGKAAECQTDDKKNLTELR